MRVCFVVHESYEGPGAFAAWADDRGHDASYRRVHLGERVPATAAGIDLLVVLGGPQSPVTTIGECPHFDSAAEQALIYDAIATGVMVVGVCLGAQLIGAALGAGSQPSEEAELGVYPIRLTADGAADPRLRGFAPALDVGHWHHDMPGLTAGAKILATSAGCSRQIIQYAELVYGLQCHPEFTRASVTATIENSAGELAAARGRPYAADPAEIPRHPFAPMNAALFGFLDRLAADYAATRPRSAGAVLVQTSASPSQDRRGLPAAARPSGQLRT